MDSEHQFIPPVNPSESRAPCPALNALANHGYLPRSGRDITLTQLIHAIMTVYNLSYALALLLSLPAILRYGKFHGWQMTIDLASLSEFGVLKIAHPASLAHPNFPSHSPDPGLVQDLLARAARNPSGGLDLRDLAATRVAREAVSPRVDDLHEEIARGESALLYLMLKEDAVIPPQRIKQWMGEERLPDNWEKIRPKQPVGLADAKRIGNTVGEMMDEIKREAETQRAQ
ncbi:hypothetical protein VNI00_010181 [Paramarasmius palmivorus]|uniref:Heme haloperoxidase family profile domain-containing protein n=1 Tax=Paramarasmius palmivorus TaxID=297713 RepID=A0AAW0CL84_9AGAR